MFAWLKRVVGFGAESDVAVESDESDFAKPRQAKSELTFNRFSDVLPYTGWDERSGLFIIEADTLDSVESVGFVIELRPQTGASEEMADYLSTLFMCGAPPGTGIQFQMFGSPELTEFFTEYDRITVPPQHYEPRSAREKQAKLLHKMMERRMEYYKKGATDGLFTDMNYRMRDFRAILSVVVPVPKRVGGKHQMVDQFMTAPSTRAWLNEITVLRETFVTTLKAYFLFAYEHSPEDLINWCSTILNMQKSICADRMPLEYDDGKKLRYQIVSTDTKITEEETHIEFADGNHEPMCMRAMSIRNYPKAFGLAQMSDLIGSTTNTTLSYPCPFLLTMGARILDYDIERNKTIMKAARATQGAESPMAKFQPDMIDRKMDWDIAQESFDDGKGTVKLYHQLLLFCRKDELAKCEQAAKAIWRAQNFDLATDSLMQKQALVASLPMMFGPLLQRDLQIAFRVSTKTVYNAANMMPVIGEPTGVGAPVMSLFGRRGQAMGVDIFANPSGNFNGCVVGTSGSGKSFFLNELTQRTLATGGRVWIIDVGRSYEKLCSMLGGQYIEFTPDSNICLNPFSMVTDIDEDMQMLKPLVAQMISPLKPLEAYELAQLDINMRQLWEEKGPETSITLLAERLKKACYQGGSKQAFNDEEVDDSACDPRIRDLGVQLFQFTEDGAFGKYFKGQANVEFTSDLVVLELEELNAMKELQSVVMFLLMYKITQEMYLGERSQRKLVIIDEAWALMGGGASGEFIEAGYRRARKYGAAFFTGTQGVGDYAASPTAQAAFDNADWLFLLRQKAESVEALAKSGKLVVDDYTKSLIKSVTTRANAYSEVFMRCGDLPASVGRLFVDPFSMLTYSTKSEEFELVRAYVRRGMATEDAVEQVLRDRSEQ
ncbi:type IV secretion system protein TraC [Ottowia sp.]|uniref:type IV secretion system protein TraC n=1 Tax=Ottowia sp. TaxID=1898956 RepID=UPI0025D8D39C|nr:type IV secretion system protein TraC [Ottowia sp.]MBK6616133.1 type IV secretion system protein TraC [Ottowia sp.]